MQKVNPSFVVGTNPNTQRRGLPFPPHTHKTKTKRAIKIRNPKKVLKKPQKKGRQKISKKQ
jgi:hypothetical protein